MFDMFEQRTQLTILDGGMGRELEARGAPFRQPEWSALALIEPDAHAIVTDTHLAYLKAGANVITTNSYAITPFHIGERFSTDGKKLAHTAGKLARQAVDAFVNTMSDRTNDDHNDRQSQRTALVAGCLPPLFGSYRPDLFDASSASDLAMPLIVGQQDFVDLWLVETVSSSQEAKAWLASLHTANNQRPVWLSFTLSDILADTFADTLANEASLAQNITLRSGELLSDVLHQLFAWQQQDMGQTLTAVLFNCSEPETMTHALKIAQAMLTEHHSSLQLGVYANAFAPKQTHKSANGELRQMRDDTSPKNYLAWAKTWHSLGANVIGGCCGIGVEHIATLRHALNSNDVI